MLYACEIQTVDYALLIVQGIDLSEDLLRIGIHVLYGPDKELGLLDEFVGHVSKLRPDLHRDLGVGLVQKLQVYRTLLRPIGHLIGLPDETDEILPLLDGELPPADLGAELVLDTVRLLLAKHEPLGTLHGRDGIPLHHAVQCVLQLRHGVAYDHHVPPGTDGDRALLPLSEPVQNSLITQGLSPPSILPWVFRTPVSYSC